MRAEIGGLRGSGGRAARSRRWLRLRAPGSGSGVQVPAHRVGGDGTLADGRGHPPDLCQVMKYALSDEKRARAGLSRL